MFKSRTPFRLLVLSACVIALASIAITASSPTGFAFIDQIQEYFTPASTATSSNSNAPKRLANIKNTADLYAPAARPMFFNTTGTGVVISQVYGAGGNSGATYRNDFVELFNPTGSNVDLTGWSIQYTSAAGNSWGSNTTIISGGIIGPGRYFLISEGSGGSTGTLVPTADFTGAIGMAASAGKVALVNTNTALVGNCPSGSSLIDFVGYGTTADCHEGSGNAPVPTTTLADIRAAAGCIDTDSNSTDFAAATVAPRNLSTAAHSCLVAPPPPVITGTSPASPARDTLFLTVNGTGTVGSTIKLYSDSSCTSPASAAPDATVGADGKFSAFPSYVNFNGTTTYYATQTLAGLPSACSTVGFPFVHDNIKPDAPINLASNPVSPNPNPAPHILGNAEAGTTVSVYVGSSCDTLKASGPATGGAFDIAITGLAPGSTNIITAKATDAATNVSDCSAPFTYITASLPTVTAQAADGVTRNSAVLHGTVTGDGGALVTERGFYYKQGAGATTADSKFVFPGTGAGAMSASLNAVLTPGTLYSYIVFATNVAGTTVSSPETQFTTDSAPALTSISPDKGPTIGGTVVTVTGTNFTGVTAVTFNGFAGTSFTAVDATHVSAAAPPHTPGTLQVGVTAGAVVSTNTKTFAYEGVTFAPTPLAFGTVALGSDQDLTSGVTGYLTTDLECVSNLADFMIANNDSGPFNPTTTLTGTGPISGTLYVHFHPSTAGPKNAIVKCSYPGVVAGEPVFALPVSGDVTPPAPTVTQLSPKFGSTTGMNSLTITGSNFVTGDTSVTIGGANCPTMSVSTTTIVCTVPGHGAGIVDVIVTTSGGSSDPSDDSKYTYKYPAAVLTGTSPASPNFTTTPSVEGNIQAGVGFDLYASADCTGTPIYASTFPDGGGHFSLPVTVNANTTTSFSVNSSDTAGCSNSISYRTADAFTFTASDDSEWTNPANWDPYYPGTDIPNGVSVTVDVGDQVSVTAPISIAGDLLVGENTELNLDPNGSLTIASGGVFTNNGAFYSFGNPFVVETGGRVINNGLIDAPGMVLSTGAEFHNPTVKSVLDFSSGVPRTFTGDLTNGPLGTVQVYGGTSTVNGLYDNGGGVFSTFYASADQSVGRLDVTGAAILSGTYSFSAFPSPPAVGSEFIILHSAGLSGTTFANSSIDLSQPANRTAKAGNKGSQRSDNTAQKPQVISATSGPYANVYYSDDGKDVIVKIENAPSGYRVISATAGPGGSIDPFGDVVIGDGDIQTFTFTPDAGMQIASVVVDGVSVGNPPTYTFYQDAFDHTISVSFQIIDTTPPIVTFTSPPSPAEGTTTGGGPGTIIFGANETATFTCSLDDAPALSCDAPFFNYPDLGSGPHHFTVTATDPSNNTGSATLHWNVDATPPLAVIDTHPTDPSHTSSADFTFTITDDSSIAERHCVLDGNDQICSTDTTQSYTGLMDGEHTFAVYGVDEFGNSGAIAPATFTWTIDTAVPTDPVVNTSDDNDDGFCGTDHCSLREAINAANSDPAPSTITFAIPADDRGHRYYTDDGIAGSLKHANVDSTTAASDAELPGDNSACPHPGDFPVCTADPDWPHSWWVIEANNMPAITTPVYLDGYSQTGSALNDEADSDKAILRIELNGVGGSFDTTQVGIHLDGSTGSVVRGLAIYGFGSHGVSITGGSGNEIIGNFIGTDVSGTLGIYVAGPSPVKYGNRSAGIFIDGSSNNMIGCTTFDERNVIAGNGGDGVFLINGASNNYIQGNFIGAGADGTSNIANAGSGVEIAASNGPRPSVEADEPPSAAVVGATNNLIGGLVAVIQGDIRAAKHPKHVHKQVRAAHPESTSSLTFGANLIAGNGGDGVTISDPGAVNNPILGNSIHDNHELGIDLVGGTQDANGVTANDTDEPVDDDTGPNNLQNFPVIDSAAPATGVIAGDLDSPEGAGPYTIEFFKNTTCDASGNGEGATSLGAGQGSGGAFSISVAGSFTANDMITATATDASGNTSEFSPCKKAGIPGTLSFSSATYSDDETNSDHTFQVAVQRRTSADGPVSINYTVEATGTATAGTDYTVPQSSGTLTWNAQDIDDKYIIFTIKGDGAFEPDETINVSLSDPTNGASTDIVAATLTITNDDAAPTVSVASFSDDEGNGPGTKTFSFTVSKAGATELPATVVVSTQPQPPGLTVPRAEVTPFLATGGTSCGAGVDYLHNTATVTIPANMTSGTFAVQVCGDTAFEPNENFPLYVYSPQDAQVGTVGGGGIVNDDCMTDPVVTNINDSGSGSLRDQVAAACVNSTITFNFGGGDTRPESTQITPTITLASEIAIDKTLNILGPGAPSLAISGGNTTDIFRVTGGTTTIAGLTILDAQGDFGGAIIANGGVLKLDGVHMTGNNATNGGALYLLGGTDHSIVNSTLDHNGAFSCAAIRAEGSASLAIVNSTVSENTSNVTGNGSALCALDSSVTMTNVTLAGNSGTNGVAGPGAVYLAGASAVTLRNTILANNATDIQVAGQGPTIVTQGYNLIANNTGAESVFPAGKPNANNDIVGTSAAPVDPLLGTLGTNGGATPTRALLQGSPAIDKGASVVPALTTDQRGLLRPVDFSGINNAAGGNGSDIGAFEVQQTTAGEVNISGRVRTADGRGITNATITVSGGSLADPIIVTTGRSGVYTIAGLESGKTYIVTVGSQRFTFREPFRIVNLTDNGLDVDFVADP